MIARRTSHQVCIGSVPIGGGAPIAVQSMTCTDTRDAKATIEQICRLEEVGCELVRVAVPDREAAAALPAIKKGIHIPLIADIHFDHRLALESLAAGVDGLRLNPGNIRQPDKVKAVVKMAKERGVPIRIGVNAGSLPVGDVARASDGRPFDGRRSDGEDEGSQVESVAQRQVESVAQRMTVVALAQIKLLESLDFDAIKISLKAFDVPTTIDAYQRMASLVKYPLHLGITEAGTPWAGSIRSAVGIGSLLAMGIGDTLRVSLTADPCEEVRVGYEILKSLDLRQRGPVLISCPTCGRLGIDLFGLVHQVEQKLQKVDLPIKVAVMGCVVNGPGEAREADVGIAGGEGRGIVFRGGKVLKTVDEDELLPELLREIDRLVAERRAEQLDLSSLT